ncbi:hypothetical protein [Promicromonospora kroppenstedtii]|uniref:hypothetical protein n=1 Tax=Promicromonospora kroppenstedtii TaxID=440482 RepID=UPI0004B9B01B|nr:hypothetical protein [Promicromonospora kroppenstedtii]
MSDTANTGTEASAEGTAPAPTAEDLAAQLEEWKGHARKHEDKAKANAKAATELAELKRSSMSDAEKAAADLAAGSQALTDAVTRAETAEAALIRYKIAVDLELSKEDVTVLDGVQGDEKTLRALAERLAGRKSPAPKPTPTQGRTTGGTPSAKDSFVEALDGLFN